MGEKYVTRAQFDDGQYPCVQVIWERHGLQYIGKVTVWVDCGKMQCEHSMNLCQSSPLGEISASVDERIIGAWAYTSFNGDTVSERDLVWATRWALEAIRRLHASPACRCREVP